MSPHTLADLFFDRSLDGQVVPSKSEHASSIGMALASVLSIHLGVDPQNEALKNLCKRIWDDVEWSHHGTNPVTASLLVVSEFPSPTEDPWGLLLIKPKSLPVMDKLWMSKILLQTLWRRRLTKHPSSSISLFHIGFICGQLVADGGKALTVLKTNCFLMMAIALGLQLDIHDSYAPNDKYVTVRFSYQVDSSINSHALRTAITVFSEQLRIFIREGIPDESGLPWVLSALTHLDPIHSIGEPEFGFLWIHELLNSSYSESARYGMVSLVVRLLGEYHYTGDLARRLNLEPAWVPYLLDFLSLNQRSCSTTPPVESKLHPVSIALRMLSDDNEFTDFGPAILPPLASTLSPTNPLQIRGLALKVFRAFMDGWFSSQMENVVNEDLEKLLQAVGDPFQFAPHAPSQVVGSPIPGPYLQDGECLSLGDYSPVMVVDILIEFASLDLWRDHLHRSNFTSYEEMTSTEGGRRVALMSMLSTATRLRPKFLSTPTKITAAIRRLEELQCSNTAQVVIMWAWTVGVVDPTDHDAWSSVENDTFRFYQTHGTGCLDALKRHITDTTIELTHKQFLRVHYGGARSPYRVGIVRQQASTIRLGQRIPAARHSPGYCTDLRVHQVCRLKMLYLLFGYDPTTWKEVVGVEEVDGVVDMVPEYHATPFPSVDWACDYP